MPDQPTVMAAIVTSAAGVLLLRRHDGAPECTFPSGAQEPGESYSETAVRETLDETGLAITARQQLGERTHPHIGRRMVHITADPVNGTDGAVREPQEYTEVGWYPWPTAMGMLPQWFECLRWSLRTWTGCCTGRLSPKLSAAAPRPACGLTGGPGVA